MRRAVLPAVAVALVGLLAGCASPAEVIQVGVGDRVFTVEVVRTSADQQRGLMYRDSMPADRGMLFAYSADQQLKFWMKNTRIPLSIAFLTSDGKVTEIRDMRPQSLDTVESRLKVRYALEVNQGAFALAGVEVGDYLELPAGFR